jgi:4-diphosphocytidyl-2-C-methyl-D-erythritol kinase
MKEKSYAKINIFLKIEGRAPNGYHLLNSRFMKVKELYDEIEIVDGNFHILGVDCPMRDNTIFKAYLELTKRYPESKKYFIGKQIKVTKNIPEMAGLGGGSSNAATFLKMANKLTNLNLPIEELVDIAKMIGSDVPFFIYDFDVANVSGTGEIIKEYKETPIDIEVITPPIGCDTAKVYQTYRQQFFNPAKSNFDEITSIELLNSYSNKELNDLLAPAMNSCSELWKYTNEGFMSGSGSSFFRLK